MMVVWGMVMEWGWGCKGRRGSGGDMWWRESDRMLILHSVKESGWRELGRGLDCLVDGVYIVGILS